MSDLELVVDAPAILPRSEQVGLHGESILPWWRRRPLPEAECWLYIGRKGSGKSLAAAEEAVSRLRRGERVLSNIRLRDPFTGRESEPFYSWDQLHDPVTNEYLHDCTIFLDEAMRWMDSRDFKDTAQWVMGEWEQSRHRGVSYIVTALDYGSIEKRFRTLLDRICLCDKTWWTKQHDWIVFAFKTRVPRYRRCWLDPYDMLMLKEGNQVPESLVEEKGTVVFVPAWVFHSYDSRAIVGSCEWAYVRKSLGPNGVTA